MELRDLQKMTVVKLREEALNMGGFSGVHGMKKQELIEALAAKFGIDLGAVVKAAREFLGKDRDHPKRTACYGTGRRVINRHIHYA